MNNATLYLRPNVHYSDFVPDYSQTAVFLQPDPLAFYQHRVSL